MTKSAKWSTEPIAPVDEEVTDVTQRVTEQIEDDVRSSVEAITEEISSNFDSIEQAVNEVSTKLVKMWRDTQGPTPHTADVHPNEVTEMSQFGWNILEEVI